jgi:Flp pilus assembly protein TadG
MRTRNCRASNRQNQIEKILLACSRRIRAFNFDERGQDLLEWTVGLPLFLVLCAGIVFYAWMWWNQVAAAAAVHDGTYLAAIRNGDIGAGYARTQRMLRSAVGSFASSYTISIGVDASRRSVAGTVRNNSLFKLPYLGAMPLNIQAESFQRREQFYGGPPAGWW